MLFGLKNAPRRVLTRDGADTFNCQGALCTGILGRCCHLLGVSRRTSGASVDCTATTVASWRIIETEGRFFLWDCIDYMGLVAQLGPLGISSKSTHTIRRLQHPSSLNKLKSSLVLSNVSRPSLPDFACTAAFLNLKLEKDQPYHFEQQSRPEIVALKTLQKRLVSTPILAPWRLERRYTLDTDVGNKQVGCVLLQEEAEGPGKPFMY